MSLQGTLQTLVERFVDVPNPDPKDYWQRRSFNLVIGGIAILSILTLLWTFFSSITNISIAPERAQISYFLGLSLFAGAGIFYILNRFKNIKYGFIAVAFLGFISIYLVFADSPEQLSNGRSLFMFAFPIVLAAIVLKPVFSFAFAILSSGSIAALAIGSGITPNVAAMLSYFVLALLVFVTGQSFEKSLTELREFNTDLDRIIAERTKSLAETLSRQRVDAGHTKAILDSVADGVIVYDIYGIAILANQSAVRLLDIPLDVMISKTIDEICNLRTVDEKNREILRSLMNTAGQHLTSYRVEWAKNTLLVTSAAVLDTEDTHIGVVIVFRDLTREAEVERMKNAFLGVVSNELRTPLNAISGYAEMFKEGIYGPVNEEQFHASDRILSNTKRLLEVLNNLLDLAHIEAGKMTIQMRPFEPAELVKKIQSMMKYVAEEKGVEIIAEVSHDLPKSINGDPAKLQQVLANLVNNAIKTTDKGSVRIRAYPIEQKRWCLEVADTGPGIPEDELDSIFEVFQFESSSKPRKYLGFGLGLSIVKQIIGLMGGEIKVTSSESAGTTFSASLPLVPAKRS